VGYFPSPCGPESLSSLLDETALLRHCNSWPGGNVGPEAAVERFRYFVLENTTLLALLEEPLGNDQGICKFPSKCVFYIKKKHEMNEQILNRPLPY
jgi:hypothetical protein